MLTAHSDYFGVVRGQDRRLEDEVDGHCLPTFVHIFLDNQMALKDTGVSLTTCDQSLCAQSFHFANSILE